MTAVPTPATDPPPTAPRVAPRRSLAPDIARGLMLALIAIANVSWYLWGHEGSVGMTPHVPAQSSVDWAVQVLMTVAVDHRAMPLFAFLFGYGMVQFYRSRLDRGMAPRIVRVMMRRRHWAMLLLGLLHAALLFYGDILGAYAVAGLLLVWIFFGRRTRTLMIWIGVLIALMVLFALFSIVSAISLVYFAPPEVIASMESGSFGMGLVRDYAYGQPYLVSILARLAVWAMGLLPGALLLTPLAVLLGWVAARHRVLDEPWRHTHLLTRTAILGITIGWLGGVPDALLITGAIGLPESVGWAFSGLNSLAGVACGVGYAAAFGLLAAHAEGRVRSTATTEPTAGPDQAAAPTDRASRKVRRREAAAAEAALTPAQRAYGASASAVVTTTAAEPRALTRALSAVGQRSLTFYLFQSLMLAPLMAEWGLGLGVRLSTASAVGIAIGVWLISLPIAAWMDAQKLRGPAELLLRRLTYGRHDPQAAGRS
ncbi:DUF418 domain-containing protein [Brachybacterium alimentarium]|uniref:DUF418 domain-containing protein n=1 Tax=Brachybacterium alimentarium TaxID=47845 RepID=UPI003FCF70AA